MRAEPFCCAAFTVLLTVGSARACPMCKDGTPVDDRSAATRPAAQQASAGLDFNASVYVMLGVVTAVAATAGRAMVKAVRG